MKFLYPKEFVNSIFDISYEELLALNKTNLIFDVDNTLVPFDVPSPTEEINTLFSKLQADGFKICLLSNNNHNRVTVFNEQLKLPAVSRAKKPFSSGIKKALDLLNATPSNSVLIGDQIFTDVWCGNRNNIHTILVHPVATRDEFTVRLKRGVEQLVINSYVNNSK